MKLYSDPAGIHSHRTRLVLAEKDVTVEVIDTSPQTPPEEVCTVNPYQTLPVLVERDLDLYHSLIIMEYLDERFPHPPLMPVDPVSRANARLLLYRIDRDWYEALATLVPVVEGRGKETKRAKDTRKFIADGLASLSPLFQQQPFLLGEQFTLVDCSIAPLLWRLPYYGVALPKAAAPLLSYANSLFEREAFTASITEIELEMRTERALG